MKQFSLNSKMALKTDSVLSINNSYVNGVFPYWISNPDGATIKKVKVMLGRVLAGHGGGSITISLYSTDTATTSGNNGISSSPNSGIDPNHIRMSWGEIGEIDMTFADADVYYPVEYKITNIKLQQPAFLIALVDMAGDIQVHNAFMWVEYEDNV